MTTLKRKRAAINTATKDDKIASLIMASLLQTSRAQRNLVGTACLKCMEYRSMIHDTGTRTCRMVLDRPLSSWVIIRNQELEMRKSIGMAKSRDSSIAGDPIAGSATFAPSMYIRPLRASKIGAPRISPN
jgi:hypothetical protein